MRSILADDAAHVRMIDEQVTQLQSVLAEEASAAPLKEAV
jgi:hypothetical protein